jgi:hypothetical protein
VEKTTNLPQVIAFLKKWWVESENVLKRGKTCLIWDRVWARVGFGLCWIRVWM